MHCSKPAAPQEGRRHVEQRNGTLRPPWFEDTRASSSKPEPSKVSLRMFVELQGAPAYQPAGSSSGMTSSVPHITPHRPCTSTHYGCWAPPCPSPLERLLVGVVWEHKVVND